MDKDIQIKTISEIRIDFSKTNGKMNPKVGFMLVPNEDLTDGRIVPLHIRICRDGYDAQNYLGTNNGTNKAEDYRDYLPNEHTQLTRMKDSVERLDGLGIKYYPILAYNVSWNSTTGLAQGMPVDMEVHKEWVKDFFQYVRDNKINIQEFDVWNEDWGEIGHLYPRMHVNTWEAMMDVMPGGTLVGPSLYEAQEPLKRGLELIEDCAKWEIPVGILAWHFMPDSQKIIDTWREKAKELPVVGSPKYYYEEYSTVDQSGIKNFEVVAEFDRTEVDEAIRGIWKYPNGLSDMVRTDQTQENPNYRLCEWWHTAAYGSMSGMRVENAGKELYIASIDEEKGEAKILIGANEAQRKELALHNLPFTGKVYIDRYKITKSVNPEDNITDRINDLPENEGIRYQETLTYSPDQTLSLDMQAEDIVLLVIRTDASVPSDFYLKTPDDNALVYQLPSFSWQKSQGAESYTLTIAKDKSMQQVAYYQAGIKGEEHTADIQLEKGAAYYWTVTAVNKSGTRTPLNGMYYSFSVRDDIDVPGGFTMLQVPNGADLISLTPRFTWSQSRGADYFVLELSTNKDFESSELVKITHPAKAATSVNTYLEYVLEKPLNPATKYYARMRAVNEHGERAMNDRPHRFLTTSADSSPMEFKILYPENGAVLEQRETLRWEKTPGGFFYELEISADEEFTDTVIKRSFLTQAAYTPELNILKPDTVYYWRITATSKDKYKKKINCGGIKHFIMSSVPAAPTLKSFVPDTNGALVIFEPVLGVDSYTVKIGDAQGSYNMEVTGITADRVFVPLTKARFCGIAAVRRNQESGVHNELLVTPKNIREE